MNQRYCNGMIHVIKKGDSLYQLSRMYRVPLALILRANPYVDVYNLQPGQEICIPVARPYPAMRGQRNSEMQNERMQNERMQDERMDDESSGMSEDGMREREETREDFERQEDEMETYVSDGTRSLEAILREYDMDLSDFLEENDLNQIIIAADVVLHLPKRV